MAKTRIRDVLEEKGHAVHSISPDASVFDALKKMADHNVGALVVLDQGKLVGIISERTYAREIVLKGKTSLATQVSEIMSRNVVCARPKHTVEECMAVMTARAFRHLPVIENESVVGIVSIGDLVKSIISDQKLAIEQLEALFVAASL